ncbi:hypoxia response transcriptional regulator [Brevibacterium antiquum]|uniref:heavy metal-responsive transcriptional regulator n=1 Tax=Brevibacterium antiquum TaxID=234835 RepID=UPI0018E05F2E|nr:heavy metal-responsive transcriptional regulator [Brevibacterium antiquum]
MRIGEVANAAGVSTKAVRFYEEIDLLPAPARSANGYRDYHPEILHRLGFITRGRRAGLSLSQVREILALHETGQTPCAHVRETLHQQLADLDEQIAALSALRATVAQHHHIATAGNPNDCDPEQICSYL